MEKKYQVFISSTFKDLEEERRAVYDALLDAECIPAGMECFYAEDAEQFNVIKRVIDLCDFYLLIIGGRYGSIDKKTRKSYTEMEYEYAVEKGIPVLVFPIKDVESLPQEKKESDGYLKKALDEFKTRAVENRMSSFWSNIEDLKYKVLKSISKAIVKYDRPGWIRGNEVMNLENIESIIAENEKLKKLQANEDNYSFLENKIQIEFKEEYIYDNPTVYIQEFTYKAIFESIAPSLLTFVPIVDFEEAIDRLYIGDILCYTSSKTHTMIKGVFAAHGLLKCETHNYNNNPSEMVSLTEAGKELLKRIINDKNN